jgi:broad specificity phosphatase PhoE
MEHLAHLIKLANKSFCNAETDDVKLIHRLIRTSVNIELPQDYKKAGKMISTLVVIRHPETPLNKSNDKSQECFRSWLDVPLDENIGILQAERLGQYFYNFPVSRIVSSDLLRTRTVAQTIQRYTNVNVEITPDLRPFNLGVYSGKSVKDNIDALLSHIKNIDTIPEQGTESFRHFLMRFYNKTKTLMDEAIEHPDKGMILLSTHSRNVRAFHDLILEGSETKVEHMKMKTLLQENDPTPTGSFVCAQHINGKWELVDLPHQDLLNK